MPAKKLARRPLTKSSVYVRIRPLGTTGGHTLGEAGQKVLSSWNETTRHSPGSRPPGVPCVQAHWCGPPRGEPGAGIRGNDARAGAGLPPRQQRHILCTRPDRKRQDAHHAWGNRQPFLSRASPGMGDIPPGRAQHPGLCRAPDSIWRQCVAPGLRRRVLLLRIL